MRPIWFLLIAALPLCAEPTIHKWVDANGYVHYSDKPSEQYPSSIVAVTPPAPSTQSATAETPSPTTPSPQTSEPPLAPQLQLLSPSNGETLRDNSGNVSVKASMDPELTGSYKMELVLDGQSKGVVNNSLEAELNDLTRGMHQLEVKVYDENGKLIASSSTATFYLFRASALSPTRTKQAG